MARIIKLTESDIQSIVERVIGDELPTEYKDYTDPERMAEEDTEEEPVATDVDVEEPNAEDDMKSDEPERTPATSSEERFTVAKDNKGTYYIINQLTGQILAKK
jgi:hypothetical protein